MWKKKRIIFPISLNLPSRHWKLFEVLNNIHCASRGLLFRQDPLLFPNNWACKEEKGYLLHRLVKINKTKVHLLSINGRIQTENEKRLFVAMLLKYVICKRKITVFTEKKGKTVTPSSTGYKTLMWCEKFIPDPDLINNKNAFMK